MGFSAIDNLTRDNSRVPVHGVRIMARNVGEAVAGGAKIIRIFLGRDLAKAVEGFGRADVLVGDGADTGKLALHFHEAGEFALAGNKQGKFLSIGSKSLDGLFGTNFRQFDRSPLIISISPEGGGIVTFPVPDALFDVGDD